MHKILTLHGMTSCPDQATEATCCALHNLIEEEGALRPIGLDTTVLATVTTHAKLVATHTIAASTHLIIEEYTPQNVWRYSWISSASDSNPSSQPAVIITTCHRANAITAIDNTLWFTFDQETRCAVWDAGTERYATFGRDDLLYDITITQNTQQRVNVTMPMAPVQRHFDAPDTMMASRQPLLSRVFDGFYDNDDAYATSSTMVAAQMEQAIDQAVVMAGRGAMKGVRLGIAALRLNDGSHILHSNIFSLWPANIDHTITADRDNGTLKTIAYIHRHQINITFRQPDSAAMNLVDGIDIFLSRPQNFLDLRMAATHSTNSEGLTTSLSFAYADIPTLTARLNKMGFYHAMTITKRQAGSPLLLTDMAAGSEEADLTDLQRWNGGARTAHYHNGRLTLADLTEVVHNPMEIGLRYVYHTLNEDARSHVEDTSTLEDELTAGQRADIGDQTGGHTAQLVIKAVTNDGQNREMWWTTEVQYPIPGMMMAPHKLLRELAYHLRVCIDGETRYFTTTQPLHPLEDKDLAISIHQTTTGAHPTQRPAAWSMLLQQVRSLSYDDSTHTYQESHLLWEEETAEEFDRNAAMAQHQWSLTRNESQMRTSAENNPIVFPRNLAVRVGDGKILAITSNTRRSADGLFGDGQYYVFTSHGLWLNRLSNGRWHAQQTVTRDRLLTGTQPTCTDKAVVFLSPKGLMMVEGSKITCLSASLQHQSFPLSRLPHAAEILATEQGLETLFKPLPNWTSAFFPDATLWYDDKNDRIWMVNPSTDENGQQKWPWALVYSLRGKTWSTADANLMSIIANGTDMWAIKNIDGQATIVKVSPAHQHRIPVLLCTHPLWFGQRNQPKTIVRTIVRGLFCHRGKYGSHLGIALYGSNDLCHWQLIGTSAHQYLYHRQGTPYRWHRILAIGKLQMVDDIEAISAEYYIRRKK